ncbi:MAG: hypothetical protein KIS63_17825, partial [Caldilineales bacterium]|nr:hypothetical protein [Caldilineales bacterium]
MLQIYFFGALRLVADGAPQVWRAPPKTLPLFAYLLLHRRQPLKRDHLAFTFWPDEGEDAARGNLRRHLHELRRALPASSAGPWLLAEGDVVQWNPAGPYWLDVSEFERFSAAPHTLALAVPLYTGDLLPELYDDWIFFERERLRETLFNCLERLTARCEAQGDFKTAIGYARHILHLDPLREETTRTLMALHYRGGDRHATIQEYRRLAQTLKTELEAPPMPETAALYEIITRGQPLPATSQQPEDRERAWAPPHNLPPQMTSFIGREEEIAALSDRLRSQPNRSPCRLITLTGTGGSGKTRLAIETAGAVIDAFPQGVWWVELASLTTGTLLANVVANALGLQVGSGQPVEEALVDYLAGKKLLLALDNCEHLVTACAHLIHLLLARCPRLSILATSREALHLAGEQVWPLAPLPLPDPPSLGQATDAAAFALAGNACVRLFVARAQAQQPSFRLTAANAVAVAEICRRLDGIPLAIELAAARTRALPAPQLARHLDDRLALLTTGNRAGLPRQQTLRNLIDWSYDLLGAEEQALFRRLAVFAGGWDLEAAEALAGADALDLLSQLVDKSLVTVGEDGRFGMLDTIRQYAGERLHESGEDGRARGDHLAYYLALAEMAAPRLRGRDETDWLDRLECEHDNLRAALAWGLQDADAPAERQLAGLSLAAALWRWCYRRSHHAEGKRWLEQALSLAPANLPAPILAELYTGLGTMAWLHGDFTAAMRWHEAALAHYRVAGDHGGIAFALNNLGVQAMSLDQPDAALAWLHEGEALARATDSRFELSCLLASLACLHLTRLAQWADAERYGLEGLALARALNKETAAMQLVNLAEAAVQTGDLAKAARYLDEVLPLSLETRDWYLHWGIWSAWGLLRWRQQRFDEAAKAYRLAVEALARLPNQLYLADTLTGLAAALAQQGGDAHRTQAAQLFAIADAIRARGDLHSMLADAAELRAVQAEVEASLA